MLSLQHVIHTDDNEQVNNSNCCLNIFCPKTFACILVRRDCLNVFSPKTIASYDCRNVNGSLLHYVALCMECNGRKHCGCRRCLLRNNCSLHNSYCSNVSEVLHNDCSSRASVVTNGPLWVSQVYIIFHMKNFNYLLINQLPNFDDT